MCMCVCHVHSFKDEIIPITVKVKDPKTGAEKEVVADTDGE